MAEKGLYNPITKHLGELLGSLASSFYLETIATKGLTERAKQAIPQGREIVFAFMKDRPDIIGVVEKQFFKHLLVAEIKESSPTLEDTYQIKRYKEVLEARYAFLITAGPIKEELKRLCRSTPAILRSAGDDSFRFLVLAQFHSGTQQIIDWFETNPFEQEFYWKN